MADLQGGLLGLMSDPSNQFYLSLLANSNTPGGIGSIIGKSAQQGSANWQDFMTKQLALQQAQSNFGVTQAMNDAYTRALQQPGGPGAPQAPQQPQGLLSAGPAQAPQPAPQQAAAQPTTQPAPQQQQDSQDPGVPSPMTPDLVHQIPVGGVSPTLSILAKARANGGDFAAGQKEVEALQYEQAQRRYMPAITTFDNLIKAANPAALMSRNMTLSAAWPKIAAAAGVDPNDKSDDNVREALGAYRNSLAAGVNLPQVDVRKQSKEEQEDLEKVVGSNGRPVLVPKSKAAGREPFNQSIFGASSMSDQAIQFAADTYRTTGKMPAGFARNPAMQAKVLDRVAQDADATGDTAASIAAREQSRKASGMALDQITKLESNTMAAADTLDRNIKSLREYAGKVDSSGVPLLNKAYRYWQQGVQGSPDVAKLVTMLNAVEGEYAKISSGNFSSGGVTEGAKRDAKDVINKYMNNGQIDAVAEAMTQEKENRLAAIRQQKESLQGQLSTGAPKPGAQTPQASSTPAAGKVMPSGEKLQAYAVAHFGGDAAKAAAFLKSQGYQ